MKELNFENLSNDCLHFLDNVVQQNEVIGSEELESAKFTLTQLLDKSTENLKILDRPEFKHLLNAIVYAYRRDSCRKTIQYFAKKMVKKIHPNYFPAYNLVFMGVTTFNGLVSKSPIDVISQLIFQKHEDGLTDKENQICLSTLALIREIFALTQLIQSSFNFKNDIYITNLFNVLDKFNELFRNLFNTHIFDLYRALKPHRLARNSIAHSHYIIDFPEDSEKIKEGEIVKIVPQMVIWKRDKGLKKYLVVDYFNNIYNVSVNEIRIDLIILSVFICQFLLLFQYLVQIL